MAPSRAWALKWSGRHFAGRTTCGCGGMLVQEQNTLPTSAKAGVALRLFWMIAGNAIIFGSLATIVVNDVAFPSGLDVIVWLAVAATIVARRVDITHWQGTTADGVPATLADWRRHTAILVLAAAAGSAIAHMLAG
jgi:hypothetical protein